MDLYGSGVATLAALALAALITIRLVKPHRDHDA
jgi:hypothetical protein